MTRETKIGLVVAGSFLAVVGGVVAMKMRQTEPESTAPTGIAQADLPTPLAPTPPPGAVTTDVVSQPQLSAAPINPVAAPVLTPTNDTSSQLALGTSNPSAQQPPPIAAAADTKPNPGSGSLLPPPADFPPINDKPKDPSPPTPVPASSDPQVPKLETQPQQAPPSPLPLNNELQMRKEQPPPPPLNPPEFKPVGSPDKKPEPQTAPVEPLQGKLMNVPAPPKEIAPPGRLETKPTIAPASVTQPFVPAPPPPNDSYLEEEYRLQAGDTFQSVSRKFYFGSGDKYAQALRQYNRDYPLASPAMRRDLTGQLPAGTVVYIPPMRILEKRYPGLTDNLPTPTASGTMTVGAKTYKVMREGGESLQEIAQRARLPYQAILQLNPTLNPSAMAPIPPGTMLRLPPEARME